MPLNRRHFLLGALAAPALAARKPLPAEHPNILLMVADDLGAYMLGCYGNKEIRTPGIDRLALTGARFSNSFASAAASSASRAALAMGTAITGPQAGEFLDAQTPGKPFVVTVTWPSPLAEPIPLKNLEPYAGTRFETIGWEPAAPNAAQKEMLKDVPGNLRKYAAGLTTLDDRVSLLQAKLQQRGLWENTLTVFTSGNGYLLGRHGLWGDGLASQPANMYDEVMRVPMIWSWPGHTPPQSVRTEVVSAYDVLPTLSDLTGAAPPAGHGMCGRSYLPLVFNKPMPKKQPWRGLAFSRFQNVEMVCDDRYKLIRRDPGPHELYDEAGDPRETTNQYDNPQFVTVRDRFTAELAAWRSRCGA
jgi:arylsulfatase A-like enzyme